MICYVIPNCGCKMPTSELVEKEETNYQTFSGENFQNKYFIKLN